jgi:crotonobetainyl-CoA:carnitine CoA-transferase CaiB-like acyl-CoA transferase
MAIFVTACHFATPWVKLTRMLQGIRIIEIEGLGPGPFAAMMLADMGADVVVIHRPGAPPMAGAPDRPVLDRGKRSIALDLKDPDDHAIVLDLIAGADALIEGFRPGVMERLGLGPGICHGVNPALVYGRITGWGQTGPFAQAAGHDLNYIAMSGAAWMSGDAGTPPFPTPTLIGDIGGGALYLVAGLLAGLLGAKSTGAGTVVDAAMYDGSAHMMNLLMMMRQFGGLTETRGQNLLDGPHWSRCYRTSDDKWISVQALEPKFYAELLDRLGVSDDPEFASQMQPTLWPDQTRRMAEIFGARPQSHWASHFAGSDACVAPVLSPAEAMNHPMNAARKTWHDVDGVLQAAPAPRFGPLPPDLPRAAPLRDENRAEILAEIAHRRANA